MDALEEIFVREGYSHLTVGELAERVRCSRRTLYDMAPSKEELFLLVLDRMWRRLGERAQKAIEAEVDPISKLEAFFREGVPMFAQTQAALYHDVEAYGPARRLFGDHMAIALQVVAALVTEGIDSGQCRDVNPEVVAEIISAGSVRLHSRDFLESNGMAFTDGIACMMDLLLNGLVRRQEGAQKPGRRRKVS